MTGKKDEGGARGGAGKRKAASGKRKFPPKFPPSAFVVFMTEFRQEYIAQHPEDNSDLAVAKAAAAKWLDMSEQEKQPYVDQAYEKQRGDLLDSKDSEEDDDE